MTMRIVLDTNVLVSALWSPDGKPARILGDVFSRRFIACYDYRIIEEYYAVLRRPKFGFEKWQIDGVMDAICKDGFSILPEPLTDVPFADESDRKFFEAAKFCRAPLITGNIKHYPDDRLVTAVADFCKTYYE